jgi:hypothetical protein
MRGYMSLNNTLKLFICQVVRSLQAVGVGHFGCLSPSSEVTRGGIRPCREPQLPDP